MCSEGDAMISACVTSSAHFDDGARLHVIPSCLRVCASFNARGESKACVALLQLLHDNSSWLGPMAHDHVRGVVTSKLWDVASSTCFASTSIVTSTRTPHVALMVLHSRSWISPTKFTQQLSEHTHSFSPTMWWGGQWRWEDRCGQE